MENLWEYAQAISMGIAGAFTLLMYVLDYIEGEG